MPLELKDRRASNRNDVGFAPAIVRADEELMLEYLDLPGIPMWAVSGSTGSIVFSQDELEAAKSQCQTASADVHVASTGGAMDVDAVAAIARGIARERDWEFEWAVDPETSELTALVPEPEFDAVAAAFFDFTVELSSRVGAGVMRGINVTLDVVETAEGIAHAPA